jgi:hypothetical protein
MFDDRALIFRSGLRKVSSKVAVSSKSMRRLPESDDCRFDASFALEKHLSVGQSVSIHFQPVDTANFVTNPAPLAFTFQ